MEPPVPGSARVGRVLSIKGRIGSRTGLVLDDSGGTARVLVTGGMARALVKSDEVIDMALDELDVAQSVAVPGPNVYGAAGRLWKAQIAAGNGTTLRAKWHSEPIEAAARQQAQASIGTRRAAALDAIVLGRGQAVLELGLSATESAWYLALAAAAAGDIPLAVGWLEQLPAQGYALRVPLLLSLVGGLLRDPALGTRAANVVAPFAGTSLDARALHGALAPLGVADLREMLIPFAVAAEGQDGQLAEWAAAIAQLQRPAQPFPQDVYAALALTSYLDGKAGTPSEVRPDILRLVPIALLDELIDEGVLPPAVASDPAWQPAAGAYLRCRLTPGEASIADLQTAGFSAELARRYFLSGDSAALGALPNGEAVRHYRALDAWRSNNVGSRGTGDDAKDVGLRAEAQKVLSAVAGVRAEVKAGTSAVVPEIIVADPTCWSLLWDSALNGSLTLPDDLAKDYPRFAEWLALCAVQRMVFDGRWAEVISAGTRIANQTSLEVTSDEAQNMIAYAQLQQGQAATALRTLDEALGGRYTTGLLVNASIVAAVQGSVTALPYLRQITLTERDQAIRVGAIQHAIDLWQEDASSPAYEAGLSDLVRPALAVRQPDDLYWRLLNLSFGSDTAWLASDTATIYADGPGQHVAFLYWQAWARAATPDRKETLADVARILVGALAAPAKPGWADVELRRMVKQLDNAVHVDFGEAAHLKAPIEILLDAGVLSLAEQCVLGAQAAAHSAAFLKESSQCLPVADEKKLLFSATRKYKERRAELSEVEREYVAEELTKCTTLASRIAALAANAEWDKGTETWNNWTARERAAGNPDLYKFERRRLHAHLTEWTNRLSPYLAALQQLPENDLSRDAKKLLTDVSREWSAELARLRRFL